MNMTWGTGSADAQYSPSLRIARCNIGEAHSSISDLDSTLGALYSLRSGDRRRYTQLNTGLIGQGLDGLALIIGVS